MTDKSICKSESTVLKLLVVFARLNYLVKFNTRLIMLLCSLLLEEDILCKVITLAAASVINAKAPHILWLPFYRVNIA